MRLKIAKMRLNTRIALEWERSSDNVTFPIVLRQNSWSVGVAHSRAGDQNVFFFEKVSYSIQGDRGRCQGTELDVPDRSGAVRWPYTYRRQYNFVGPPGPPPTIPKARRRRRQRRSRRRAFSFPSFPLGAPFPSRPFPSRPFLWVLLWVFLHL